MNLIRADVIQRFANMGYTKKDAAIIIDDFVNIITEELINGNTVKIHGFGQFEIKEIPQRKAIVDVNGRKEIHVPTYKYPKFTAGKSLRQSIREAFADKGVYVNAKDEQD
jgi:DNA-binding protein HU-beta